MPVLETNHKLVSGHDWSNYGSPLEMDVTGSDKGIAAEPGSSLPLLLSVRRIILAKI